MSPPTSGKRHTAKNRESRRLESGAQADWLRLFERIHGSQQAAFTTVLETSLAIDKKYGTTIADDVAINIMAGNYKIVDGGFSAGQEAIEAGRATGANATIVDGVFNVNNALLPGGKVKITEIIDHKK